MASPGTSVTLAERRVHRLLHREVDPTDALLARTGQPAFHAAAWSLCWLCAVWAKVTDGVGDAGQLALRHRVDRRLVGADREVLK